MDRVILKLNQLILNCMINDNVKEFCEFLIKYEEIKFWIFDHLEREASKKSFHSVIIKIPKNKTNIELI